MELSFDDQLRFGLLAIEQEIVSRDQLRDAIAQWLDSNDRSLPAIMIELEAVSELQYHGLLDLVFSTSASPLAIEKISTGTLDQDDVNAPEANGQFSTTPPENVDSFETLLRPSSGSVRPKDSRGHTKAPGIENRFQILKRHAKGGLGVVFLANDDQLNRLVAIKQIRRDCSQKPAYQEKFYLEAEVTGQLEHPGIVPVYALGIDDDNQPYYAMRFIHGENLGVYIERFHNRRLKNLESFDGIMFRGLMQRVVDVCHAIEYAHSRRVLHRDLKPANIMLGNHGETLVVDWGLAKMISDSGEGNSDRVSERREAPVQPRQSGSSFHSQMGSFVAPRLFTGPAPQFRKIRHN